MTDDIVTRLRMPVCGNYDDDHPSWGPQPCSSCVEAADEIERLRAEIIRLNFQSQFWQTEFVSCWRDLMAARS
jgi:hypothetical protein